MKNLFNYLSTPIRNIWNYFVQMNSESNGGGVSIKRNLSWGIASLVVFVQIYSLVVFPHALRDELDSYKSLCEFYVIVDISFILLALSITSIEKLTDLVQRIKGGIIEKVQVTKSDDVNVEQTSKTTVNNENPQS